MSKLSYPRKQLAIMHSMAEQLFSVIHQAGPDLKIILIEEVNLHKSRLTGKTLDGMHWILLNRLPGGYQEMIRYRDSDGETGWRTRLNLRLTEMDKKVNAEHKKINKRKKRGTPDLVVINKKHLAARYVNAQLGTAFDIDSVKSDGDVVDAIGLGLSELLTLE